MLQPPHATVETLYREHHRWLIGWLRQRLGDGERAADISQDTFLRLISQTLSGPLNEPRSFLATVARRVMIDHLRRRTLEQAYLEALAREPEGYACSAETHAMLLDTVLRLDAMLDGLGNNVRQAFLWAHLDGLSYAQIADQLGVSISAVTKYMSKATAQCLLFMLDAEG